MTCRSAYDTAGKPAKEMDMLVHRGAAVLRLLGAVIGTGLALMAVGARADIKFKPGVGYPIDYPDFVKAADLDKDGNVDLFGSASSGFYILYGKGDGTFEPPVYLPGDGAILEADVADLNQDGRPD